MEFFNVFERCLRTSGITKRRRRLFIITRLWKFSIYLSIFSSIVHVSLGLENESLSKLEYEMYNSSEKHQVLLSSSSGVRGEEVPPAINPLLDHVHRNQDNIVVTPLNESAETLSQESSEQKSVVFVADSSGYVPINQYRSRLPIEYHHESWDRESRRHKHNFTRVQHIEAECQDDYMKIRVGFNGSFTGLLYSSGYSYDPDCIYINGTGRDYYEFYIQLNRCGTLGKNAKADESRKSSTISKNFMWNTITVQYNPLIEEEWDEHFKVTCEYGYDFWKTVTFPFLDVEVATGNPVVFTLSPPECYMEIRYGYGTSGTRVTGPVRVGDPLTLIIYMRSKFDGFDIVVNDCYAHNGATKKIQLIDQYGLEDKVPCCHVIQPILPRRTSFPNEASTTVSLEARLLPLTLRHLPGYPRTKEAAQLQCPVDDKLISRFRGSWSESGIFETQVFAYMKTFRFTGSPALYIECDVRMCHGRCPSQPCHWRNAKSLKKRAISAALKGNETSLGLSNEINLFQSLRVLQEGESAPDSFSQNSTLINGVCLKYGAFSAIIGFIVTVLCLLSTSLLFACIRLRRYRNSKMEPESSLSPRFDHKSFMIHKGRIH